MKVYVWFKFTICEVQKTWHTVRVSSTKVWMLLQYQESGSQISVSNWLATNRVRKMSLVLSTDSRSLGWVRKSAWLCVGVEICILHLSIVTEAASRTENQREDIGL